MTSLPSAPADEGSIAEMMRLLFALGRAPLEMVFQLCSATLGAVGKKKKLRRVTQTYLFRCRIAVGIDPRAPFLSILPRKPLKCGKTAQNGRFS